MLSQVSSCDSPAQRTRHWSLPLKWRYSHTLATSDTAGDSTCGGAGGGTGGAAGGAELAAGGVAEEVVVGVALAPAVDADVSAEGAYRVAGRFSMMGTSAPAVAETTPAAAAAIMPLLDEQVKDRVVYKLSTCTKIIAQFSTPKGIAVCV